MPNSASTIDDLRPTTPVLLVWPAVPAWRIRGQLWLDRKFKDGMDTWCDQWPGCIRAVMEVAQLKEVPSFGAYRWSGVDERFDLAVLEPGEAFSARHLEGVDLLMSSADNPGKLVAPDLCRRAGVACIMAIEYTLSTRLDMLAHSRVGALKRLKTVAWFLMNERRIRSALRRCDAVQANGIPAYDAYARARPGNLLYFDTRLAAQAVITADALQARLDTLQAGRPLRLAFSGRLIGGKGADALVPLAARLRKRGLDFRFDIYGDGELKQEIAAGIHGEGLQQLVTLHGPIDFATQLMPRLKESVDLFVCCHRQGDPSCTYAETLGCGVPIVGFANESLGSLVDAYGVGWATPMNALDPLADVIVRLDRDRADIAAKSRAARDFGTTHSFETTFRQRIDHGVDVLARRGAARGGDRSQVAATDAA